MGEWIPFIDTRHYHRNLFDGLDAAPDVPTDRVLIVADAERPAEFPGVVLAWLSAAGLDRSTPYRGIAVVDRATADGLARDDIGIYRPDGRRVTLP